MKTRTIASQGGQTTVALFDAEEYAELCSEPGLDTDTLSSRTHFTAELVATGWMYMGCRPTRRECVHGASHGRREFDDRA
ncbi:hypothetical protein GCM10022232_83450 [Streptomyces plumbiresistens]|uniref:Uncharacterized protein n=1 Tax=Streptomyces plumbiresistens TaxID=511811 RepID=A0ABP7TGL0_9ACTN